MIYKIRLATGIIFMVVFVSALAFFLFEDIKQFEDTKQYKYYIGVPHSRDYRTNSYTSNGGCITFKNEHDNIVTLCGDYTIITK